MNSALQCLSNVPELTEYFLSDKVFSEINASNVLGTGGRLAKAYAELIRNLWSGNNTSVKPYEFKVIFYFSEIELSIFSAQLAHSLRASTVTLNRTLKN